jgi:hypothetical protein
MENQKPWGLVGDQEVIPVTRTSDGKTLMGAPRKVMYLTYEEAEQLAKSRAASVQAEKNPAMTTDSARLERLPDVDKIMERVNWQRVPWHLDLARNWLGGEVVTDNDKRQASAHLAAALELLR